MREKPTYKNAFLFWLKLGFISFGGPAGQIAIMHESLVEEKKWISESKFMHALNYCMVLPGPEAQQLATYIGWMLHGTLGGLTAGILFVLPSMFILLGLSIAYVSFGTIPWVYAMFVALKPAVIAIVILALVKIGKKSLQSYFHYIIALSAFIGIFFLKIPFPYIILGSIIAGALLRNFLPNIFHSGKKKETQKVEDESEYFINKNSAAPLSGFYPSLLTKQLLISFLLWCIPVAAFYFLIEDFQFWKTLSLFFTEAAFVTFGGAYAVLPFVAQYSVETLHWLSSLEMMDGLALGETTPGPLIMVLAFVGFMAGYHHHGDSLWMGTVGLVATTFFTFLPCFLFIFAGAPIIEKTQENKYLKEILSIVTAAVVGVVLNLTIYLAKAVLFEKEVLLETIDWISLAWVIISFVAMYRFKLNMILWIGISAAFGLVRYFGGF